jgi:hypothetical protein
METNTFSQNIASKRRELLRKYRGQLIIGVVALITLAVTVFAFAGPRTADSSENKPTVQIKRSYEVVARLEDKQRTTGRFNVTVTQARYADSILVQGSKARPIKGKTFLVLDMEIENPHKISLYAFPVDLFRFVREDSQKFAPSVHQGTVLVRPEATKKSNIGFVVSPTEKSFKIEVGEVGKTKEILEITF